MEDFVIVKDHPQMLLYIDMLQKKNAEALSFYPKQVFEREKENGRIFLGLLNGEPCGYLYVGASGGDVKCHQVCIQYDARRKLYGAMLATVIEQYAKDGYSNSITLRCGFDLDANKFWSEMGYNVIRILDGGVRRMRKINVWRKYLMPQLFQDIYLEPASGKTDASLWRKHKETGIITQFARGKKMNDYRLKLLGQNDDSIDIIEKPILIQ
jgi:GNAT superfamily N-acetyltransferase